METESRTCGGRITPNALAFIKDDITTSQKITFIILAFLTLLVGALCCSNGYLLFKNKRFKNTALSLFYFFSIITLTCKPHLTLTPWDL